MKIKCKTLIEGMGVLVFALTYFGFLQRYSGIADPDAWYHAKFAALMSQQGIIREFPYLPFTYFTERFADHHFLYHVALIPFVKVLPPIMGLKLATALFGALFVAFFYGLLKQSRVAHPMIATALLLASSPFVFRIMLGKANVMSLFILFAAVNAMLHRRPILLATLSALAVLSHGSFPILFICIGIYCFSQWIMDVFRKDFAAVPFPVLRAAWKVAKKNVSLLIAVFGGIAAGMIVNPYFPRNVAFYYEQVIEIALINYKNVISVGGEWYPYPFFDFIGGAAFAFMALGAALYFLMIRKEKNTLHEMTLFFIMLFFFFLTLRSQRNVEYFIPFAVWFSFLIIPPFPATWKIKNMKKFFIAAKPMIRSIMIYGVVAAPFLAFYNMRAVFISMQGHDLSRFQKSAEWMARYSKAGDIVFHSSWDEFPILFYFNSTNFYISGLDPTFFYRKDAALYQKYIDITLGKETQEVVQTVKEIFHSRYVFVQKKDHEAMSRLFRNDFRFTLAYEDEEAEVYLVPR